MKNSTIDDAPSIFGATSFITTHGKAKGGGEVVAEKLSVALGHAPILSHRDGYLPLLRQLLSNTRRGRLLCSAGPRDLPLILLCMMLGKRVNVYLQVPYSASMTSRDIIHLIFTSTYLAAVIIATKEIAVNSKTTAKSILFRRFRIILPFIQADANAIKPAQPFDLRRAGIVTACRLNRERGRGSRDLDALIRLAQEILLDRQHHHPPFWINHYGECAPEVMQHIEMLAPNAIIFNGHKANWIKESKGPVVLLSKYEGFGLAAFEAAAAGRMVYVNQAFPDELIQTSQLIRRIDTSGDQMILPQIQHVEPTNPHHLRRF